MYIIKVFFISIYFKLESKTFKIHTNNGNKNNIIELYLNITKYNIVIMSKNDELPTFITSMAKKRLLKDVKDIIKKDIDYLVGGT